MWVATLLGSADSVIQQQPQRPGRQSRDRPLAPTLGSSLAWLGSGCKDAWNSELGTWWGSGASPALPWLCALPSPQLGRGLGSPGGWWSKGGRGGSPG